MLKLCSGNQLVTTENLAGIFQTVLNEKKQKKKKKKKKTTKMFDELSKDKYFIHFFQMDWRQISLSTFGTLHLIQNSLIETVQPSSRRLLISVIL